MSFNSTHYEKAPGYLKNKAEKALKVAKELDFQKIIAGKKLVKLDDKTVVLR